jgi:hypothetical protein
LLAGAAAQAVFNAPAVIKSVRQVVLLALVPF